MRANVLVIVASLFLLSACKPSGKEGASEHSPPSESQKTEGQRYLDSCDFLRKEARYMDSVLLTATDIVPATANRAIKAFTGFAFHCVSDSMSPVYLIKTAQVARVINNIPQAKVALDRCIDTYPAFEQRPAAIFLLAQLYDEATYLNDEQEALKLYRRILEEYPKSEWVPAAESAIKFLGKSDEEIIKEFTRKQRKGK